MTINIFQRDVFCDNIGFRFRTKKENVVGSVVSNHWILSPFIGRDDLLNIVSSHFKLIAYTRFFKYGN